VKRRLVRPEGAHHGGGQVVFAVGAAGIAALDEEEGGSLVDHDTPGVRVPPHIGAILDIEPKAQQVGHLLA
jgi:hypothetical protein